MTSQVGKDKRGHFLTTRNELMKFYCVYTGNNLTTMYECGVDTPHGGECVKTTYTYDVNDNVEKMREELSTWDSSYDV